MTTKDFSEEQVLNLDNNTASNFAVYNEKTAVVAYQDGVNQMTDNGSGTYTVKNAGSEITSLKEGDTFSYTDANGVVSIIKVKTIQIKGSTATITEDKDVELEDVFDYVKIEGGYQQEASQEPRASALADFELDKSKYSKTEKFDWTKKLGSGGLTATLKASGALTAAPYVKVYLAFSYQYVELTLTMDASFDCSASGKLARQSVDLLPKELSFSPIVGINITFMPRLEFEASGNVSFSAQLVTVVGFSCDGRNGLVNKSSGPRLAKCDFHIEATVYLGLGLKPGVSVGVANVEAGSISLDLQVGAQITGKMDKTGDKKDVSHTCKTCIAGDIVGKLKLSATLSLIFIGQRSADLANITKKLTDFYYSVDYGEFGWTTCPHTACKVTLSVTDINKKPVSGAAVEGTGLETAPVTDGSGRAEFYLPNGTYTLKITKEDMSETVEVQIQNAARSVSVQLAKSALIAYGTCGENLEWKLGEDGTLTISGTGNMTSWSYRSQTPWDSNRKKITSLVLESGVTDIGAHAFDNCENLISVEVPDGITDIGDSAFYQCNKLSGIVIPGSVKYIGNSAFSGCSSLTGVQIPAGVTNIGNSAFGACSALTEIEIPESVTVIGNSAFSGCTGLLKVTIPAGNIRIGDSAFSRCSYLLQADIGGGIIGKSAFSDCSSLTTAALGNEVTDIGAYAFSGCSSLKSMVIPDGIKKIARSTFGGCTSLSSVELGTQITTIEDGAFSGCTRLGSVTFPSNVNTLRYLAFSGCTSLADIWFTGSVSSIDSYAFSGVTATVYYPSTWEGASPRGNYNGNSNGTLTWVVYDPASAVSAEPEDAAFINQEELQSSASEIAEPLEDPSSFLQEDLNAVIIESEPPTAQAFTPFKVYAADGQQTKEFTGLIPGGDYVLLVSKDLEGTSPLAPSNLLYITDGRADSRGSLTFTYIPRTNETAQAKVYAAVYETNDTGNTGDTDNLRSINNCDIFFWETEEYIYSGDAIEPGMDVVLDGTILEVGIDYMVSYENNIEAGTASVTVTGTGDYTGEKTVNFTIKGPSESATTLTGIKVNVKKRKMTVRWDRVAKVKGYQIQYSTKSKFGKGTRTVKVSGARTTSRTIGGLTRWKTYYVRVRTYRKKGRKLQYSDWSNVREAVMIK